MVAPELGVVHRMDNLAAVPVAPPSNMGMGVGSGIGLVEGIDRTVGRAVVDCKHQQRSSR